MQLDFINVAPALKDFELEDQLAVLKMEDEQIVSAVATQFAKEKNLVAKYELIDQMPCHSFKEACLKTLTFEEITPKIYPQSVFEMTKEEEPNEEEPEEEEEKDVVRERTIGEKLALLRMCSQETQTAIKEAMNKSLSKETLEDQSSKEAAMKREYDRLIFFEKFKREMPGSNQDTLKRAGEDRERLTKTVRIDNPSSSYANFGGDSNVQQCPGEVGVFVKTSSR